MERPDRRIEPGTARRKHVALDGHSAPVPIALDLMVPEAVGGAGRRAARIPPHGERTARKARGIEAVQFDCDPMRVCALDATDARAFDVNVAGSAALLDLRSASSSDSAAGRGSTLVVSEALEFLRSEFARPGGLGPRLAAWAAAGSESADIVAASVRALSEELLVCLRP